MSKNVKSRSLSGAFLLLSVFLVVILGIIGFKTWKYLNIGVQIVTNNKIELKQTSEKRINLLLLGVGGGTHEGPDLTDTIIFATIDPKTKKALLVSIPRDLWITELSAKINTAYLYGEKKKKGEGLLMAKAMVGKVMGQQIDYVIKIDFEGFVKAIDQIGGLDIVIDRTFDDYAYPIADMMDNPCGRTDIEIASLSAQIATSSATELEAFPCRYEHLHFDEGQIHMSGATALKYARSRHALGPEGSDFARSKRQEKIISAFKEKIISLDVILNPVKLLDILETIKGNIVTDIREDEYDDFIRLARKLQSATITSAGLDEGDLETGRTGLLINPPTGEEFGNQWVLIPTAGNGDYSEIHKYITCEINKDECANPPTPTVEIDASNY